MLTGSCLCRQVTYAINGEPQEINHCHCSMCRRMHGGAYATFARVSRTQFQVLTGASLIRYYVSSPGVKRSFCATCGAKFTFEWDEAPDLVWIACGTLDDDPGVRPSSHIFVGSKAPWYEITDSLPRHEGYPE